VDQLAEPPAPVRELDARVEELSQLLEQQAKKVTEKQLQGQEHAQLVRDLASREARLATIVAELESVPGGYHETRHAQLRQQHDALAPLARRYAQLTALAEREPAAAKERARVQKAHSKVREAIDALTQERKKSRHSEKAFTELRAAFELATSELRAAELAALAAEKELEAARAARAAAETSRAELERVQTRMRGLTMDRRLHDELDHAFTDIRAGLNEHLRPEISEIASGFLAELTDGRYSDLELDDDYNIVVKEDDIPKPVISGGEEDLAHLVLRLAISQMIADRAGQSFSLLILDEVFGSLDEARRHNVVELLRRLHDRFEQVILITHIESVREGLDRVLTVRYDEDAGVSRVHQDTGGEASVGTFTDETLATDEYAVAGGAGD
jgi:exonuclease SbcC